MRPAHGLVALHGADVVTVSALGLAAGRITHGHRFQGARDIVLANADEYAERLAAEGGVLAGFAERRAADPRGAARRGRARGRHPRPEATYARSSTR